MNKLTIKRNITIILLILTISISFIVGIGNVYADEEGNPSAEDSGVQAGSSGGTVSCGGYSSCYSLGTAGVRIQIVKKNGEAKTKPIDFWLYKGEIDPKSVMKDYDFEFRAFHADKKYMRNNFKDSTTKGLTIEKSTTMNKLKSGKFGYASIETVAPNILNGFSNEHENNKYVDGDKGKNTRMPNIGSRIIRRLAANANHSKYCTNSSDSSTCEEDQNSEENYLDNILKKMVKVDSDEKAFPNGIYDTGLNLEQDIVQVEPLIQWGNVKLGGTGNTELKNTSIVFFGTLTEYNYFIAKIRNNGHDYTENSKFEKVAGYGIYSTNTDDIVKTFNIPGAPNTKSFNYSQANDVGFVILKNIKPYCNSAASKLLESSDVSYNLNNLNSKSWDATKNSGFINKDGIKNSDLFELKYAYLKTVFVKSNTKVNTDSIFDTGDSEKANNFVLNKLFGYKTIDSEGKDNTNYCETTQCSTVLNFLKSKGKLNGKINEASLNANLSALKKLFPKYDYLDEKMLSELYSDEAEMPTLASVASCKEAPTCAVNQITAKCSTDSDDNITRFTISDATYDSTYGSSFTTMNENLFYNLTRMDNSCLNQKIAYNAIKTTTGFDKSTDKLQSSTYNGEYGKSVCWESVSFELPKSVGNSKKVVAAGNVFRWGLGDFEQIDDNNFGKMHVTRYCTVQSGVDKVGSEWANVIGGEPIIAALVDPAYDSIPPVDYNVEGSRASINPSIMLYYTQAIPSGVDSTKFVSVEKNLGVKLNTVITNAWEGTGTSLSKIDDLDIIDYTICNDSSKTLSECNDKMAGMKNDYLGNAINEKDHPRRISHIFKNGGVVKVDAYYDIVYPDHLKWYSDRSKSSKLLTKDEIPEDDKSIDSITNEENISAKYNVLGYGLPTSFVTPPTPSGDYYYGYTLSDTSSNGKMYVTISDIGTKTRDGYHFNKLIKAKIADDDNDGSISADGKIVYSCGFKISNKLYCNECKSDSSKPYCPDGECPPPDPDTVPTGIDVVFRTVELINDSGNIENAFPGRTGQGRKLGYNWSIYDKDEIAKILRETVYDNEPLYKIKLDTVTIQNIRRSNTSTAYTNMNDYVFESGSRNTGKRLVTIKDAQELLNSCKEKLGTDKADCESLASQILKIATDNYANKKTTSVPSIMEMTLGEDGLAYVDTTEDYVYAASPFITDLISNKKLEGKCAMTGTTEERAKAYAATGGCIQAE